MNIFGVQSHLYKKNIGGDSIDLFLVFRVERETVTTQGINFIHIYQLSFQRLSKWLNVRVFPLETWLLGALEAF